MKKLLLSVLIAVAATSVSQAAAHLESERTSIPEHSRVFEMRTYYTNPGKLQALHARFRDHTNTLFVKHGMSLIGYWAPEGSDDTLVYILAYDSKEAREAAWKGFMNDPAWKAAYAESTKDGKLVKKVDSVFMSPTDYSPIR